MSSVSKGEELFIAARDGEVEKVHRLLAGMNPAEVDAYKDVVSKLVLQAIRLLTCYETLKLMSSRILEQFLLLAFTY